MTTEEKKIEEAAYALAKDPNGAMRYSNAIYNACVLVAKSDAAKEYHSKGMITEEQCYQKLHDLMVDIKLNGVVINDDTDLKQWFDKTKTT